MKFSLKTIQYGGYSSNTNCLQILGLLKSRDKLATSPSVPAQSDH